MGGQYVTAASKVTIVGWLLCEAVVEGSVDPPHRLVSYDDCYALCLPWVSLGLVGPFGCYLPGGVLVVWGF